MLLSRVAAVVVLTVVVAVVLTVVVVGWLVGRSLTYLCCLGCCHRRRLEMVDLPVAE